MPYFMTLVLRLIRFIWGGLIAAWLIGSLFTFLVMPMESSYKNLQSIAIDRFDNLYIADAGNSTVYKYDTEGNPLATWGGKGSGDGQFSQYFSPAKIVADFQGELYITDEGNKRIQKFDSNGRFLGVWGNGPNGLYYTGTMVIDNQGQVYSPEDNGIRKFDAYGNFIGVIGENKLLIKQLGENNNLAVNSAGEIYAYDRVRGKVFRFDAKGQPLPDLVVQNLNSEYFDSFSNITLDRQNNIYFMDLYNGHIIKLDPTGQYITSWTYNDKANQQPAYEGMVIDSRNNLYLLNTAEYRVEVFDITSRSLKEFGIGWPKWLTSYNTLFLAGLAFGFATIGFLISAIEKKYRTVDDIKPVKTKGPFLAPSLAGKVSQLLNFMASITGFAFTLVSSVSILDDPTGRFISFEHGPGAGLVGRVVALLFVVAFMWAMHVRKRPVFAGLGQIILASIIYFASLEQYVRILAVIIVIGGLLAIASAYKQNTRVQSNLP